jgi:AraC-like DNA-binding protein
LDDRCQLLINLDLMDEMLKEAIFGGPPPQESELRAFLSRQGIRLPARVSASSASRSDVAGTRVELHPGLAYWFAPVKTKAEEPTICRKAGEVIRAIQQAILVHRREQLQGRDPEAVSDLAEGQAFHLALVAVRSHPGQGGESLRQWLQIIIGRHQAQISEIRRRMVEFLSALTRGVEAPLGYPFSSAIRRIYETFDLLEIGDAFSEICEEIGKLIAGRSGVYQAGSMRSEVVSRAFRYMEASAFQPIGLDEVARATHVSAPHLARMFRRETGRTVGEHLLSLRINRARELLATTDLPALDVAADCGFESVEHFYRMFRRVTGVTPRSYRKSRRA